MLDCNLDTLALIHHWIIGEHDYCLINRILGEGEIGGRGNWGKGIGGRASNRMLHSTLTSMLSLVVVRLRNFAIIATTNIYFGG